MYGLVIEFNFHFLVNKKKREARQKESLRDEQRQKALDEELERKAEKFKARRRSEPVSFKNSKYI